MDLGNRVFYDQDGDILFQTWEISGDVLPRKEITELHFVDLEFGSINYQTHRLIGINPVTKQPILAEIPVVLTPEQQQIKDLEDALLLVADAETGGIL